MNAQTLEIIRALLSIESPKPEAASTTTDTGKAVLVRTFSAGVHFGTLEYKSGEECRLRNARRIWHWKGANTLHEIALRGVDASQSKISEPVGSITLTNAIEIIPLTEAARINLEGASWKS